MEISTKNKKLQKAVADHRQGLRLYGKEMSALIERRVAQLKAINCLGDLWPPNSGPERCHELTGDRSGVFSLNLKQPYRLLFIPTSVKAKNEYKDDKAWWNAIESVELLAVEDTHE